jgi:hypothetical protein
MEEKREDEWAFERGMTQIALILMCNRPPWAIE